MQTINATPFPLLLRESEGDGSSPAVTCILKATFDLVPDGPCTPARTQRKPEGDLRHMDELGRSLSWATDFAPYKPHTDVLIQGSFHQPGGLAAPTGRAGFELGPLRKELLIHGPRFATPAPPGGLSGRWSVSAATPIVSLPLRWEYSYGGLNDRRNPMGRGQDVLTGPDGRRQVPLPQIEHPDHPLRLLTERPPPANFAPVPPGFAERRAKLGTRDRRWSTFRAPLPPADFDPSYHNAAPAGQQAGNYPRGDELLTLRNLHPRHPVLRTYLPGLRASLAVLWEVDGRASAEVVPMNLDTIVALPDEDQLVLVWRGNAPLRDGRDMAALTAVACEAEPLAAPPARPDLAARLLAGWRAEREQLEAQAAAQAAQVAAQAELRARAEAAQAALLAATMGEVRRMLGKVSLPAALRKVVETETDPQLLYDHLDRYVTETLAEIEARHPGLLPGRGP
ncbi:DUF2169 domain-containing protein [Roseomonas sp. NAR14]|uniref:DUF2169 domain-containing protein n=1 Tax=Roseomonas acroporae TaxID=2937791 RepID=A0A9X1Y902_9PROT|nr:DUF2169 domain-containing protein [Roseomonas acroporae]MCK8785333.1 DUF2169 domain-containing protein [Roseomonas acroporae]